MKIRYAQWNEFRYACLASRLCIRVLITLRTQPRVQDFTRSRNRTDSLERHRGVDSDQASNGPNAKCHKTRYRLPYPPLALHELFQRGVSCEPHRGVRACVARVSNRAQ